jgi:hypothetical protein
LQERRIHIAYNPELTRQQLLKATYDAAGAEWQTHKAADLNPWATQIPPSQKFRLSQPRRKPRRATFPHQLRQPSAQRLHPQRPINPITA